MYLKPAVSDGRNERVTNDPYRLPKVVVPLNYSLTIKVEEDFHTSGTFSGSVYINIKAIENVDFIKLHALFLDIDPAQAEVVCPNTPHFLTSISNETQYQMITLELMGFILAGTQCSIHIKNFNGKFRTDLKGFYVSSYINEHGIKE